MADADEFQDYGAGWSVDDENDFEEIRKSWSTYTRQDYEDFRKRRAAAIEFERQTRKKLKVLFGDDHDSEERRFYFQRLHKGKLPSDDHGAYLTSHIRGNHFPRFVQGRIYPTLSEEGWQEWEDPLEPVHEYPDFDAAGKVYSPRDSTRPIRASFIRRHRAAGAFLSRALYYHATA